MARLCCRWLSFGKATRNVPLGQQKCTRYKKQQPQNPQPHPHRDKNSVRTCVAKVHLSIYHTVGSLHDTFLPVSLHEQLISIFFFSAFAALHAHSSPGDDECGGAFQLAPVSVQPTVEFGLQWSWRWPHTRYLSRYRL